MTIRHPAIARARAGDAPKAQTPKPAAPVIDHQSYTRADAEAGRCSGIQVNTMSLADHQALLRSRGAAPLSMAEIKRLYGPEAAEGERQRLLRVAAARPVQPAEKAVRYITDSGVTYRVTVEILDDGGER
jgi:hypothetical protein